MPNRRFPVVLMAAVGLLVACSGSSPQSTPSPATTAVSSSAPPPTTAASSSAPATTAATPARPFVSASYHYAVASTDWTGTDASRVWDGSGSPGNADPRVDVLDGPHGVEAYAFGEPTSKTLEQFVAHARAVDAKVHPCSSQMPSTTTTTIGGAPAVIHSGYCPPPGGPFVIGAYVVHAGRAYVFLTVSIPPGSGPFTRHWFLGLLREVRFTD
ncbi:MAG TPA: hypothetical protein VNN79_17920 [Actinomycetota bacterium]|nr:hypothetical protein [Actinomycetota bacterium]